MTRRRLKFVTPAVALMASLALVAGCGTDSDGGSRTAPEEEVTAVPTDQASAPAADAKVIDLKLSGNTVSPAGTTVEVKKNQQVVFNIEADKAGELHVHSTPEKHLAFPAGTSTVTVSFDKPGVVDVEDHALDKLLVQLEVR